MGIDINLNPEFDKLTLSEIEKWEIDVQKLHQLILMQLEQANAAKQSIIAAQQPPPLPPALLPEPEVWRVHPQNPMYEYNPQTNEVRKISLPPVPESETEPENTTVKRSYSSTMIDVDGVAVPEHAIDEYLFIKNSGNVCFTNQFVAAFPDKKRNTIESHLYLLARLHLIKKISTGIFEMPWKSDKPFIFDSEQCSILKFVSVAREYKRPFDLKAIAKRAGITEGSASVVMSLAKRMGYIDQVSGNRYFAASNPPEYVITKKRPKDATTIAIRVLKEANKPMHYIDLSREIGCGVEAARKLLLDAAKANKIKSIGIENSGSYVHIGYQMPLPLRAVSNG